MLINVKAVRQKVLEIAKEKGKTANRISLQYILNIDAHVESMLRDLVDMQPANAKTIKPLGE